MKKTIILICVFLMLTQAGFTEERDSAISVGMGPEFNMNSRENFAGAICVNMEYQLPFFALPLSVGLTITASSNFDDTSVMETTGMARWYFLGTTYTGFFAQFDIGTHFILERDIPVTLFETGLRGGYRLPLGDTFYVEPYGRFGYPYFIGFGVLAGMTISLAPDPSRNNINSHSAAESSSGAEE